MNLPLADEAEDTTRRIQSNVHNLPITSVMLAGLLGAGLVALISLGFHAHAKH